MTCSAEATGIEAALRRLVARGFQFLHPRSAEGSLVAVVGVRAHDDVVDVVALRAAEDAKATRMPADEPDVLAPSRVQWEVSGSADTVMNALLALPDTGTGAGTTAGRPAMAAGASGRALGCWVPLHAGRSAWLVAS